MRESEIIFREVEVRSLLIMIVAVFASLGVNAAEEVAESMPVPEVVAPVMVYDLAPAPTSVSVAPTRPRVISEIKAYKPRIAEKTPPSRSILSRTARNQIALMVVKRLPARASALVFDDQDVDGDSDDLDLQCFYGRPKLVKVYDQSDEPAPEMSEHAKLRLLVARAKAVEAHQLLWPAEQPDSAQDVLSDTVKLRLALARMKAVQAHQKLYS